MLNVNSFGTRWSSKANDLMASNGFETSPDQDLAFITFHTVLDRIIVHYGYHHMVVHMGKNKNHSILPL